MPTESLKPRNAGPPKVEAKLPRMILRTPVRADPLDKSRQIESPHVAGSATWTQNRYGKPPARLDFPCFDARLREDRRGSCLRASPRVIDTDHEGRFEGSGPALGGRLEGVAPAWRCSVSHEAEIVA